MDNANLEYIGVAANDWGSFFTRRKLFKCWQLWFCIVSNNYKHEVCSSLLSPAVSFVLFILFYPRYIYCIFCRLSLADCPLRPLEKFADELPIPEISQPVYVSPKGSQHYVIDILKISLFHSRN